MESIALATLLHFYPNKNQEKKTRFSIPATNSKNLKTF